ncbi:MAG: hypothetical protein LBK99_12055 [Opitutaceae bacterium]|nr:hypothetical protein [Opitutaceae bacterium]
MKNRITRIATTLAGRRGRHPSMWRGRPARSGEWHGLPARERCLTVPAWHGLPARVPETPAMPPMPPIGKNLCC